MATLFEGIKNAARSAFCSIASTGYDVFHLLKNAAAGRDLGAGPWASAVRIAYCNNPTPYPDPPPSLPGGQCPGVIYIVSGSYVVFNKETGADRFSENFTADIYGPISGLSVEDPFSENSELAALVLRGRNSGGGLDRNVVRSVSGDVSGIRNVVVSSVVRLDGQPDSCGSLPSVLPPPTAPDGEWNKRTPNVTYTNNDGLDLTVPVVLLFGYAKLDVDASVSIPIKVTVGPINFNLSFNLNTGDIQLFPDNNYYGDRRPGTNPIDILPLPGEEVPDYPPSLPPGPIAEDPEGEDQERVIVGCVVTTTSVDTKQIGTLFQDENPNISIPNLGYISFLCRVGYFDGAWTEDIPVKNRRQVIQCPWEPGAVKVAGTPRSGVEWVITPLYSLKEQPIEFAENPV